MNCGKGDGYTRVEMSFNGSLNIKQTGHAMLHIDQYDEDHLIPFPDFKVRGFLSGHLYPEIACTYHHITSSGFLSEIKFSGQGLFSSARNSAQATLYRSANKVKSSPVYVISGQWNGNFTIFTGNGHVVVETWRLEEHPSAPLEMPDVAE